MSRDESGSSDSQEEQGGLTRGHDAHWLAQKYSTLVNQDLDLAFADRPLLAAAWAAQVGETLRVSLPGRGFEEVVDAMRQAAFPPGLLSSFQALVGDVGGPSFQQIFSESVGARVASLTRAADFRYPDLSPTAYSPSMTSPEAYFSANEEVINSMGELNTRITTLVSKTPDLQLVWRGARSAKWAIHSGLFRHLCEVNGVISPEQKPREPQPYPDEDQLVRAETEMLRVARTDWRFDGLSALETFARIQHAGGPTRLLDVTKNPYIAAWFAVEQCENTDEEDARLIAFATQPVRESGKPTPPDSRVGLDTEWGDRNPPWHLWTSPAARQGVDWGTGARRRLWIPPAYDPRIAAQNAAFIFDGVPITSAKTASYFKNNSSGYWTRADLLAAASIYAKTVKPTRKPQYNGPNLAPTFTFRITAGVKGEIRAFLESRFGYTRSYVYPDVTELASYLRTIPLAALE